MITEDIVGPVSVGGFTAPLKESMGSLFSAAGSFLISGHSSFTSRRKKKSKNNVCQEFPENKVMSWEFLTGWRRTTGLSSSPTGEREKEEREEKNGGGGSEDP